MGSLSAIAASGRALAACAVGAMALVLSTGAIAQSDEQRVEELLLKLEERDRKLEERDAVIADLLKRVQVLEQRINASAPEIVLPIDEALADANPVADKIQPVATVVTPLPRMRPQTATNNDEPAQASGDSLSQAPGQIEVDEEAAERALERTLVQAGALLLPFGTVEVEPSFAYTRRETDAPLLVAQAGLVAAAEQQIRRDEFDAAVDLRFGLPFDSQLEFSVPYRVVNQDTVNSVNFSTIGSSEDTGHGIGDVSVGVAKTFLRESGWQPDVIGRVTWDSDTANEIDNGVPLGGGFHEVRGSLVALKRQDPLAFVGSASYETAFESDNIDPGDTLAISLAAILAASPETSLRVAFDQSFVGEVEVGGARVDGSDQTIGSLTLGAATILGPGVLLDVAGSVGLTEDAADYAIVVSVPIRFNTGLD